MPASIDENQTPLVDVDGGGELPRIVVPEAVVHAQLQTARARCPERPVLADEHGSAVLDPRDQSTDG